MPIKKNENKSKTKVKTKVNTKVKTKVNTKVKTKVNSFTPPEMSGPRKFSELPLEDQKLIGPPKLKLEPNWDLVDEDKKFFSSSEYKAAMKIGGTMTDTEAIEVAKKGRRYLVDNFPFDSNKFAEIVENDNIPFDQMMTYVTNLLIGATSNKSFDDVVSKFFNFHLGKMDLKELVVLKYKIEQLINQKAIGSQDNVEVNYKIG